MTFHSAVSSASRSPIWSCIGRSLSSGGVVAGSRFFSGRGLAIQSHAPVVTRVALPAHEANTLTVGKGVVDTKIVDEWLILAGLVGAIVWDIITWYWGIPTSSSHAIIGGFAGAAVAKGGFGSLVASGLVKIGIFMILAPLIGFTIGFALMLATVWTFRQATPGRVDFLFRRMQLVSAAAYSLGHGTNDAQKTMGIIAVLLFSTGHLGPQFYVPFWVVLAAHAAMGLGTLSGGWRIVKTMGMRITKLRPVGGFCAETSGAVTLIGTAIAGIPVSTTHTITGSIVGVGSLYRLSAVRWGVAGRIVWAWIFTIPASGSVAAACWLMLRVLAP
jgi:inorganic phosphate transporter, PiT family